MSLLLLLVIALWLVLYLLGRRLHHRGGPDLQQDVLAAGLLALACLAYFWRILFGGATMPADGGDLVSFLYPTYRFAASSLSAGSLPLWNPHLYGGAPHVADIQAGFLYPPNLLLFLLRPQFGIGALQGLSILHLWWAGLGLYAFLRSLRWGIGRPAALAAGLAFAFSDPFWVHFGNLNFIAVASWLPWVMLCYVRALENAEWQRRRVAGPQGRNTVETYKGPEDHGPALEGDKGAVKAGSAESTGSMGGRRLSLPGGLGWAALGGLLLGIATLAGHVQATLFIGLAVVLYGALFGISKFQIPNSKFQIPNPAVQILTLTAVLALVAALIAAPVLLPAGELAGYTARAQWTYQQAVGYSLSPPQWIGLLIPGFFGRGPQLHWGLWPRVEVGYLGVLPLALVALALLARRERRTWILAALAGIAFVLALGVYSLPHGWLSLLPGFNQLRAPARLVLLMDFALAALAGAGFQILISPLAEGENWRALTRLLEGLRWASKVVLAVAVPLTFGALLLAQDKDPTLYLRVGVTAIAVLLFAAFLLGTLGLVAARKAGWAQPRTLAILAIALLFLDLSSTGAYFDLGTQDPTVGFDHPQIVDFLAQEKAPFRIDARTGIDQLWQPDTALLHNVDDVWGVANPSVLAHYERYWEGMGSRSGRLYDFLNAKYVVARKDVELDWEKFELAFAGDPQLNLYLNGQVLPRAQVLHEVQVLKEAEGWEAAWRAIQAPGFDPGRQAVVEQGDATALPTSQAVAGEEGVNWLLNLPNERLLEVTTTAPGYLVLSEPWYPGWIAETTVAGKEERQPVLRANYAFQAVPLWQAGTYQVRLRFQPVGWTVGLVLSGLTLLTLAILAALTWRLRKRVEQEGREARRVT